MVLTVLLALSTYGFVDESGFAQDIDFANPEWHVFHVRLALSNFEFTQILHNPPAYAKCEEYTMPFTWLACMIVRGSRVSQLEIILNLIISMGMLGKFDIVKFRTRWPDGTILKRKPLVMEPVLSVGPQASHLAVFLPMGIPPHIHLRQVLRDFYANTRSVIGTFDKYFGVFDKSGTGFPAVRQQ